MPACNVTMMMMFQKDGSFGSPTLSQKLNMKPIVKNHTYHWLQRVPTQETWQDDIRQAQSRSNHRQRKDKPHTPHCCSSMVERIGKVAHCTSLVWRSTATSKKSTGKQQQGKERTSEGLISLSPIMALQFPKHGGDHCSYSFSSQN